MKIEIVNPVQRNYQEVFDGFSAELFEYLAPKGQLKLLRFDGCGKGDVIDIQFLKPIKARWISEVVKFHKSEEEIYFIDEGRKLPFGLVYWQHQHIIRKTGHDSCDIIEKIEYQTRC